MKKIMQEAKREKEVKERGKGKEMDRKWKEIRKEGVMKGRGGDGEGCER